MIPAPFEYLSPRSVTEAVDFLSRHGEEARLIAGGQSLVPLMKLRLARPKYLIDLGRLSELNFIREEGDKIVLGALTTHAQIENSELLKKRSPLLPQTAVTIGDVQVRNQGTIGGSLTHADPAADMPAAILALRAELKAVGPKGERWMKAEEFFVAIFTTALSPDEILTEVRIPVLERARTAYLKAASKASAFAVAGIAVCLQLDQDRNCKEIAIGVTGVTDRAYRAQGVEKALNGKKPETRLIEQAAVEVTRGIDVTEDVNASKEYRSHIARITTTRAIHAAMKS